ncbi:baseplate J/gp47 family protein [Iodobacter sp.]|uniref:baseplate assembly protein n=1 Tax=Iodobacter sp. TaxID=1915058 RepID=UPI0025F0301E|nr:baseplate J/gp47 family protein [Iodobacter sp.]
MIDLSLLPAPSVIEKIDFETLLKKRKARLLELTAPENRPDLARVLALESEPLVKLLEENAYQEMVLRARINDAAKAGMLAYAQGADLDHACVWLNVKRLLIDAGDPTSTPPKPAIYENDTRLRLRAQMALEGLSVAGSRGAYLFHTLSASAQVDHAQIIQPTRADAGHVRVIILDQRANGIADANLIKQVSDYLSAETIRPLTDYVTVEAATPINFSVVATLEIDSGPDRTLLLDAARKNLDSAIASFRKISKDAPRSAIYAALHVPGVSRVVLTSPAADVICNDAEFPFCTSITLSIAQ